LTNYHCGKTGIKLLPTRDLYEKVRVHLTALASREQIKGTKKGCIDTHLYNLVISGKPKLQNITEEHSCCANKWGKKHIICAKKLEE
jgi:hypothetical protein